MTDELLLEKPVIVAPATPKPQRETTPSSTGWPLPSGAYGAIVGWIDDTWGYTYHLTDGRVI